MPEPEDEALVRAYLGGDERAFADIYRRYAAAIFGLAWRSLGDRDQAEEVVASTFAHAAARLGQLREPAKLRSWLFAVARAEMSHLVRSVVRERRRRERAAALAEVPTEVPASDEAYAGELLALARDGLSPEDRTLLGLILGELSNAEIADALGVTVGTLDTRKSRLYDRLRLSLEVYWVTRPGRADCSALSALLVHRKETALSRALCRAVERHCRTCSVCDDERKALDPFALLAAAPIPVFVGHIPTLPITGGQGAPASSPSLRVSRWSDDGFPAPDRDLRSLSTPRNRVIGVAAAVVVALAVVLPLALRSPENVRGDLLGATGSTTAVTPASVTTTSPLTVSTQQATTSTAAASSTTIASEHAPAVHPATSTTKPTVSAAASPPVHHRTRRHPSATTTTTTTTTTSTTLVPGQLVLDTTSIAFGSASSSATIDFHDPGASISWAAVSSASWLSLSTTSGTLATGSSGQLTVTMNRQSAPTGSLTASVTLTAGVASAEVAVTASEDAPPSVTPNVPSSIECVAETAQASVAATAGVFSVVFELTLPGASAPIDTTLTLANGLYSGTFGPYHGYARQYASWVVVASDGDGKTTTVPSPAGSIFLDC